ncbi:MAG: serine/threonine protein kinase [Myxococcales bacterium]|nr:serine/threonine protein kinase [Myxococcales bacterium]
MTCPHCNAVLAEHARFCPVCGKAMLPTETQAQSSASMYGAAPDLIGREIAGRYRILAKLGEGGMGAVYRGEQISLKRPVAVKVLRSELSSNQMILKRFNAEAEVVAKLGHPNTVNIYDFGQDRDGSLFIAMEFIEGQSLRKVLHEQGPLPPARTLSIAIQIAASLADAHAHGITHRDLKPDNVMLQDRGRQRDIVRVLDFGIAKLRDDSRATQLAMTQAGDMLGTPQYMAPEQIRGEAIDGRTDVYALGCMLYEMLTSRMPFEAPTVMAMLSKHLLEIPPPPSVRRPDLGLPPLLDQLVMAAMSKAPNGRPATMEQLGEHLAALLAMQPPDPNRPPTVPMSALQGIVSPPPITPVATPMSAAVATPASVTTPAPVQTVNTGRGGHGALYAVLAVLVIGGGGAGIYVATRPSDPKPTSSQVEAPPNEKTVPTSPREPEPATPVEDKWKTPDEPSIVAPEGIPVDVGQGVTFIVPPDFQYQMAQGGGVVATSPNGLAAAVGPLTTTTTDLQQAARDYAKSTGLTLDKFTTAPLNGVPRPIAVLHGTVRGVQVAQVMVAFVGASYKIVGMVQFPLALHDDKATQAWGDEVLGRRIRLP